LYYFKSSIFLRSLWKKLGKSKYWYVFYQVYNKNFEATCKAESQHMRTILHVVFNPTRDELISCGLAGTTVWKYKQITQSSFSLIKPMANYRFVYY